MYARGGLSDTILVRMYLFKKMLVIGDFATDNRHVNDHLKSGNERKKMLMRSK